MKHELSLELIKKWMNDNDWMIRLAAIETCKGHEVPWYIIERGLNDENHEVRTSAMKVCVEKGIELPIIRTFEPPEKVYKKCVGDVIVVAHIPDDAQVRGCPDGKGRASKATILEVIGDLHGEPVGVSTHDKKTMYHVGDEVVIEDFDYGNEMCSTGFHFFCTLEQAKKY